MPSGLKLLKSSAAVDQDVYVVTKEFSAQHGITSLEDLQKIASTSTLGGPPELEERAYGPPGLEKIYGAKFKAFVPYPKYPPKISDLDTNKIQVATFFTTDAVISEKGYVQLEDPQSMILPQNVVPLVRSDVAEQRDCRGSAGGRSGSIDHRGTDAAGQEGRQRPPGSQPRSLGSG